MTRPSKNFMISDEMLQKYKQLYKEKTGEDLADQEALEQAIALVTLVDAVYRPIPKSPIETV